MRILIASILPVEDIKSWSGICNAIHKQLSQNHQVKICYSSYAHKAQQQLAKYSYIFNKITGKRLNVYFSGSVAKLYGKALKQEEESFQPDLILCLGSGTEIFDYTPKTKTYLVADACFNLLQNDYVNYSSLTNKAINESENVEHVSIAKFDTVFTTSEWAKRGFEAKYPTLNCKTINFGSNLESNGLSQLDLPKKSTDIKLLTVGLDYIRKGIDKTEDLQRLLDCKLDIVGIDNKLDKVKKIELNKLINLYASAHFFVLFPTADCTPIVINEANSFGLPVIAFNTGGISSMISNGVNGYLVKDLAEAKEIILRYSNSNSEYNALRASTYKYYTENLSYPIFEQKLLKSFEC
jgi:glycosyltransferase involved in cell wall biosynthesis